LVGDTAAVAEVTAQHAQILAKKVHWLPAGIYSTQLSIVRKLLIEAGNISDASNSERIHLSERFQSTAAELAGWKIPDGLREYSAISHPTPILSPAELDKPSAAEAPTAATVSGLDASDAASGLGGLDARPGTPNTLPDSAAPPPLSVTTPTAVDHEQAEEKRQTLPTCTGRLNDDTTNPITWVASLAPLDDSADQPQSPGGALAAELRKVPDILNNPYLSTGTEEATDLGRAIDGLSTLD